MSLQQRITALAQAVGADIRKLDVSRHPAIRPSLRLDFINCARLDPRITFTRASGAWRYNASGQYEWLAADQPRIDYDPVTGECLGLLIEEQRTNLLLNSATLATQTLTVTATAHTLSFYGTGSVTLSGAATGTLTGTGAGNRVSMTFTPAAGALTLTVSGSGASGQLETGAFPTSYIPTTGAQVTRAADVASVNVLSPWFNASEGTLVVEYSRQWESSPFQGRVAYLSGPDTSKAIQIRADGSGAALGTITDGGLINADIQSAILPRAGARVAFSWGAAGASLAVDGAMVGEDGAVVIPQGLTTLWLGNSFGNTQLRGHIRSVRYYPKRLSDSELQAITA